MIDLKQNRLLKQIREIKRTRFRTCIMIAITVAVVMSLLFSSGLYSNIQLKLSDYLYGGTEPIENIVIVEIDEESLQQIGKWPWARGNYTKIIEQLEQSAVIGFDIAFFDYSDKKSDIEFAEAVKTAGNAVLPAEYISFNSTADNVKGKSLLEPIDEIKKAAAGIGYINVITDYDGVTRAVNTNIEGDYGPFAYAILGQYVKKEFPKQNRQLINFVSKPGSFKRYPFHDVIGGKYPKEEFKGRIVLVGATAKDLHDDYFVPTSYGTAMPGAEIHANIVQQMITGKHLQVAGKAATALSILIFSIAVAIIIFYLPVLLSLIISILIMIGYTFCAILLFDKGIILNLIYIPATIITAYVAIIIFFYKSEKKSRKEVLGAFEKYVSKDVINHILENPSRLKLGGERREITIFFSDIRGFTTISEKMTPEQLVNLLNEYLSEMTDIILKHNGVVDKFMGDAIMAFWNAPLNQKEHAELCCSAALEMNSRLKELQKKWVQEELPSMDIGIGINTGAAVVGNMGSYQRFDYTAMGDTVNISSRLEGLNKLYGTRIIISEATKEKISKSFFSRKLDRIQVKGKKEPIAIYELLAKGKEAADYREVKEHFEKGLELYFRQKWNEAEKEFKAADENRNPDMPSKLFIERCRHFRKNNPGEQWNGAWIMETK